MSITYAPQSDDLPRPTRDAAAEAPEAPAAAAAPPEPPQPGAPEVAATAAVAADVPRVLRSRSTDDIASLVGSAAAAVAFTWIVYEHILAWSGSSASSPAPGACSWRATRR